MKISKGQIWRFKDGARFIIISDDDSQRWGIEDRLGWGFNGLEIPYGKTEEEGVHEDAMTSEEILGMAEFTGETR